jgi:hypothetical protein
MEGVRIHRHCLEPLETLPGCASGEALREWCHDGRFSLNVPMLRPSAETPASARSACQSRKSIEYQIRRSKQVISLPQGGGALHGIGETFVPDLHTGTGNFTVPIALPPGRNGFQPQLNLIYSTGDGNGPFGLGWSLSIPSVRRKTSKGIPRYADASVTFLLSGAEDLVPVTETAGATSYRPRTEGSSLASNIAPGYPHTDHWEVRSKDELVSVYGTPLSIQNDPAVNANPENRSQTSIGNSRRPKTPSGIPYVTTTNGI